MRMDEPTRVVWVYDVISPFAYLSLPRLQEFSGRVTLEPRPVLFAALLDHFGQRGPAEISTKRRFTYRFALWRARRLKLPMRLPPAHPVQSPGGAAADHRRRQRPQGSRDGADGGVS